MAPLRGRPAASDPMVSRNRVSYVNRTGIRQRGHSLPYVRLIFRDIPDAVTRSWRWVADAGTAAVPRRCGITVPAWRPSG